MQTLLYPKEFLSAVSQSNTLVFDTSFGSNAYNDYLSAHLPNAQFVDLETELSLRDKDPTKGGRHPLPSVQEFVQMLGRKGVARNTTILIYNQGAVGASARFWWMLKAIGHENIHILNGKLKELEVYGAALSDNPPNIEEVSYDVTLDDWMLPTLTMEEVKRGIAINERVMVDARAANRFKGEVEPIDPVAGHIPNAVNLPFLTIFESGILINNDELEQKLNEILTEDVNYSLYCGSGVTACYLALALDVIGKDIPPIYMGSWSEWCRNM